MEQPPASLASPAQLLEFLEKSSSHAGGTPLEELLDSVHRQQAGAAPPSADQLEVFPEPGFVIKTADEQGRKVFINVCGSAKVPLPGGWAQGQVPAEVKFYLEMQRGGDAPAVMRFSLSTGLPRLDTDHKGEACIVLDCILNSELLHQAAVYRPLKLFIIQMVLATVEQKNSLQLNPQYKLPKMRYKGDVPPPQFIRVQGAGSAAGTSGATQQPLVSEVEAEGHQEAPAFALLADKRRQRRQNPLAAAATTQSKADKDSHARSSRSTSATPPAEAGASQLTGAAQQEQEQEQEQKQPPPRQALEQLRPRVEYCGRPATAVRIAVPLPAAAMAAIGEDPGSISTSVCAELVRVHVLGCREVEVQLPFAVSAASATAEVLEGSGSGSSKSSSLVVTLPYRPFSSVLAELQQAAAPERPGSALKYTGLSELD